MKPQDTPERRISERRGLTETEQEGQEMSNQYKTWKEGLPDLLRCLQYGTEEGQQYAKGELQRMAMAADCFLNLDDKEQDHA